MVRSFLSSNKNIDGILALGSLGALPIVKLLKEIDVQKKIKIEQLRREVMQDQNADIVNRLDYQTTMKDLTDVNLHKR